jgi:Ca-activated chloride channel family protein
MTFSRKNSLFLPVILSLTLFTTTALAQDVGKQEPDKKVESSSQPSIVLLNVRVTDEAGRPVSDVRQEDVRVVEDGVPQTISFFSKEEVPLSYGLLIDNSGSMRSQLDQVIEAGRLIVNGNQPGDETFLLRFVTSDSIQLVSGFTSNKAMLFGSLDSMFIEGGQTAVIDAVLLSLDYAAKNRKGMDGNRRLALVIVTDGEDRASRSKRAELAERLHREDIQIFAIGLVKQIEDGKSRDKAKDLLKFLAQETGGRAFFPNSTSELVGIAQQITRDLRTQYLVGYIPANAKAGNTFHKVQVTVAESQGKEKRVAVTRVGYIAAPRSNQ